MFFQVACAPAARDWLIACGTSHNLPVITDQPFHTASIGKTFTATLIALFIEKGQLLFV